MLAAPLLAFLCCSLMRRPLLPGSALRCHICSATLSRCFLVQVGRDLPDLIHHLRSTGPHPRSLFAATVSQDDVRQAVGGVLERKDAGAGHSLAQVCARYPAAVWASAPRASALEVAAAGDEGGTWERCGGQGPLNSA